MGRRATRSAALAAIASRSIVPGLASIHYVDATVAAAALSAADPRLGAFIQVAGPYEPRPRTGDAFASLSRAILFQQLAGRAAAAIHARFVDAIGGQVTPHAVLAASPETLRAAGLSANKAAALRDLATKALDGTVPLADLSALDDEDIIARLSTVRGIGRWTAEMFLIFELQRPDVWPVDDLGVRHGWSLIHSLPTTITPAALRQAGEPLRPYRSLAAWYCWRAVSLYRGGMVLPEAAS